MSALQRSTKTNTDIKKTRPITRLSPTNIMPSQARSIYYFFKNTYFYYTSHKSLLIRCIIRQSRDGASLALSYYRDQNTQIGGSEAVVNV